MLVPQRPVCEKGTQARRPETGTECMPFAAMTKKRNEFRSTLHPPRQAAFLAGVVGMGIVRSRWIFADRR
jgi:hypothetical protein